MLTDLQIAKLVVYEQYASEACERGVHAIAVRLIHEILTSGGKEAMKHEAMLISNVSILRRILQSKSRMAKVMLWLFQFKYIWYHYYWCCCYH